MAIVTIDELEYPTDHLAQMAYKTSATPVITLDNFEYPTDCLTQASYPTNGHHAVVFNGNAQLDTAFQQWCTASLLLDGTNDWLSLADSPDWDICANAADDWTIDFWVRHDLHDHVEYYIEHYEGPNDRWFFTHSHGGGLQFAMRDGGVVEVNTGAAGEIADNNWHHVAMCKVGNDYGVYLGGNITAHDNSAHVANFTGELLIGRYGGGVANHHDGHMDEIRIVHGNPFGAAPDAGLLNTITVPIAPHHTDTDTKLLLHLDGADGVGATVDWSRLESRSEDAILQEGSYSLEGFANTDAINDTLTRTVAPTLNLSGRDEILFEIRSSRTGSNIKIGIRDGAVTTEITPNIAAADTWQTVSWDISGVADADKDAIDRIQITIVNAAADNLFYIDDMRVPGNYLLAYSEDTILTQGSYSLRVEALETLSLNATLTKAFTPWINLTDQCKVNMDIYASRTGENFSITFRDHDGETFEVTPNILTANAWQNVELEISRVDNSDKDQIDRIIVTILNADEDNTFYLDDIHGKFLFRQLWSLEENLFLGAEFIASEQAIYRPDPSTEFLTEEKKRDNTPAKRIFHYVNDRLYDLTKRFISMGAIDKRMTYKPGETNLLTISDQKLTMSNWDQYFSDLNPDSVFYDRDYAGVDKIEVYAGFINPDTGYAEVLKKAEMKLMGLEIFAMEGTAQLRCQDYLRSVFDVYAGMPTAAGVADPLNYKQKTFRWVMEDLLVDEAGFSPDIMGIERITQGDLDDDNGDFEGAGPDGTDITGAGVTDWTDPLGSCSHEIDDEAGSGVDTFNGSDFCAKVHTPTAAASYIELSGADFDAVFTLGESYRLSFDYKTLNIVAADAAKVRIFNAGLTLDESIDLTSAIWTTPVLTFTVIDNTDMTLRIYVFDVAVPDGDEVVWIDNIEIRQVDPKIDIENVLDGANELLFLHHTFTRQRVIDCLQIIAEVGRGNVVVLCDGTIQFSRFASEGVAVDMDMVSGLDYSRVRYIGQDYLQRVNKVVVIGDAGIYAEAELPGEVGIALKYENEAIETVGIATAIAEECIARFAVHPALVGISGEYLPSLDLKSIVRLYEPNTLMNPKILQVSEYCLDIMNNTTRLLLKPLGAAGVSGTWGSEVDLESGVLVDILIPEDVARLELKRKALTGTATYQFDIGAGKTADWIYLNSSEENVRIILRDDFRENSLDEYYLEKVADSQTHGYTAPTYDAANKRIAFSTGDNRNFTMRPKDITVQDVVFSFDFIGTGAWPTAFQLLSFGRWVNNNNMYAFYVRYPAPNIGPSPVISKIVSGVWTDLTWGSTMFSLNTWYEMVTTIHGNSLKIEIVDLVTLSTSDGRFPNAGGIKFGGWQGRGYIDNLLIEHYALPDPVNCSVTFRFRTSDDGIAWSAWTADITTCADSRMIEIEVTLTRTDLSSAMPTLKDMTVGYTLVP